MTNEELAKYRDLTGDIADCLNGDLPHDSLTGRGSMLFALSEFTDKLLRENGELRGACQKLVSAAKADNAALMDRVAELEKPIPPHTYPIAFAGPIKDDDGNEYEPTGEYRVVQAGDWCLSRFTLQAVRFQGGIQEVRIILRRKGAQPEEACDECGASENELRTAGDKTLCRECMDCGEPSYGQERCNGCQETVDGYDYRGELPPTAEPQIERTPFDLPPSSPDAIKIDLSKSGPGVYLAEDGQAIRIAKSEYLIVSQATSWTADDWCGTWLSDGTYVSPYGGRNDEWNLLRYLRPLESPAVGRTRMIVCETCGNKRCPHATDTSLACTGSNAPGQAGSKYGAAPSPGPGFAHKIASKLRATAVTDDKAAEGRGE